jgi:hypothetical protein
LRGPVSAAGKARSARSALKHGLTAREVTLLADEDAAAFGALDAAFRAELQPESELQNELVARVVLAAWRGRRADRIESDLFARHLDADTSEGNLGAALVRDGYGPRVVETLLRYRASVHADFFRALRALRVLQGHEDADEDAPSRRRTSRRAQRGRRRPR